MSESGIDSDSILAFKRTLLEGDIRYGVNYIFMLHMQGLIELQKMLCTGYSRKYQCIFNTIKNEYVLCYSDTIYFEIVAKYSSTYIVITNPVEPTVGPRYGYRIMVDLFKNAECPPEKFAPTIQYDTMQLQSAALREYVSNPFGDFPRKKCNWEKYYSGYEVDLSARLRRGWRSALYIMLVWSFSERNPDCLFNRLPFELIRPIVERAFPFD